MACCRQNGGTPLGHQPAQLRPRGPGIAGGSAKIWVRFDDTVDLSRRESILAALAGKGIECLRPKQSHPSVPGLVVFDRCTADLCAQVNTLSEGGLQRILAVTVEGDFLDPEGSWQLVQAGASDVLAWGRSEDPVEEVWQRLDRWKKVDDLAGSAVVEETLVGQGAAWTRVLRQVIEIARFTDSSVTVTGESGTGKELVARLIHTLDPRPNKGQLVILDCTTVVPTLSGSEFFGHEKGAFTGAVAAREGAFALADGGTLFLDEIGELPPPLQAELLRVIEHGTYKRVGSNTWRTTSFRLVCATNRDLLEEAADGRFRRDLYYRIAAWVCHLPPLRQRPEDIGLLAQFFLRQAKQGTDPPAIDRTVADFLVRREYPGNIRDLRQLITRISARHVGAGPITVGDVPPEDRPRLEGEGTRTADDSLDLAVRQALSSGEGLRDITRRSAEAAIRIALSEEKGNLRRAARRLGVTERALQLRRASGGQVGRSSSRGPRHRHASSDPE